MRPSIQGSSSWQQRTTATTIMVDVKGISTWIDTGSTLTLEHLMLTLRFFTTRTKTRWCSMCPIEWCQAYRKHSLRPNTERAPAALVPALSPAPACTRTLALSCTLACTCALALSPTIAPPLPVLLLSPSPLPLPVLSPPPLYTVKSCYSCRPVAPRVSKYRPHKVYQALHGLLP